MITTTESNLSEAIDQLQLSIDFPENFPPFTTMANVIKFLNQLKIENGDLYRSRIQEIQDAMFHLESAIDRLA